MSGRIDIPQRPEARCDGSVARVRRGRLWMLLGLVAAGLVLMVSAAMASAAESDLAGLPFAEQSLTAYGGYVVFSQSNAQGTSWALMQWHAGQVSRLPVPARSVPFAADAGPDVHGHPAVVYSRCQSAPSQSALGLDWTTARGCRIYELGLLGGPERRVTQIGATGFSDSTPSIWKGAIAFARTRSGAHTPIAQVLLWRPGRPLRRLGAGTVPCVPARACPGQPYPASEAWVGALDLGQHELAMVWNMQGENVIGVGESSELRVDPLSGGAPRIADDGVVGGACIGGLVISPNATPTGATYLSDTGDCNNPPGSPKFEITTFTSFMPSSERWESALPSSGYAVALAQDGRTSYWMRYTPNDPTVEDDYSNSCKPSLGTCTLMQTTNLDLRPDPKHYHPSPPTA